MKNKGKTIAISPKKKKKDLRVPRLNLGGEMKDLRDDAIDDVLEARGLGGILGIVRGLDHLAT